MNTPKLNKRKCKSSSCENIFQKKRPLDMFCSPKCHRSHQEELDAKKLNGGEKKKGIAPVSDKRLAQLAEYRKRKAKFMKQEENKFCPVNGCPTTDIHHVNGREGERLNDETYWLAVSRDGHQWIHSHPEESREKGWLI